jgi:hypothetical protein
MKLPPWRIEIRECEIIPRGYGPAFVYDHLMIVVCYPLGIHAIVGVARKSYYWFLHAFWKTKRDEWFELGRQKGFTEGKMNQMVEDADRINRVMDYRNTLVREAVTTTVMEIVNHLTGKK